MKSPVRIELLVAGVLLCGAFAGAEESEKRFEKRVLTGQYFCDGVAAADIDQDGHLDVIAGPYWYQGPQWEQRYAFYEPIEIPRAPSPSNSMFSFVHDFDRDGDPDILVLGRVHRHAAYWYENPLGNSTDRTDESSLWKKHYVFERIRGESPAFFDFDRDGTPELVCHWEDRWGRVSITKDPTSPWSFLPFSDPAPWPQFYHGTGIGDVDGDGRMDVLINDGWFQQPDENINSGLWRFHSNRFSPLRGGAQMFADDIDGDGNRDVITSLHAHEWGLAWFQQRNDGDFEMHKIMGDRSEEAQFGVAFSQPHALEYADLNNDGRLDIVTGKRRWAHGPDGDVEPSADPVVYWFENTMDQGRPRFIPHLIDKTSGVGTQIAVADLNEDGQTDVLTASKLGVFVFLNRGPSRD